MLCGATAQNDEPTCSACGEATFAETSVSAPVESSADSVPEEKPIPSKRSRR
jgi:hypothetical protein